MKRFQQVLLKVLSFAIILIGLLALPWTKATEDDIDIAESGKNT